MLSHPRAIRASQRSVRHLGLVGLRASAPLLAAMHLDVAEAFAAMFAVRFGAARSCL